MSKKKRPTPFSASTSKRRHACDPGVHILRCFIAASFETSFSSLSAINEMTGCLHCYHTHRGFLLLSLDLYWCLYDRGYLPSVVYALLSWEAALLKHSVKYTALLKFKTVLRRSSFPHIADGSTLSYNYHLGQITPSTVVIFGEFLSLHSFKKKKTVLSITRTAKHWGIQFTWIRSLWWLPLHTYDS